MMTMVLPTMMTKPGKTAAMRHEFKHQINQQEDLVLSQRLRKLFAHDKHAGQDGTYGVTSLYFDTPYDGALREKIDGVNRREKFRLRYYGEDTSFIRLERKYKVNGLCGKQSAKISLEQTEQLLAGEYGFLLDSGNPLFIQLYSKMQGNCLRPKTIVYYEREAFTLLRAMCGSRWTGISVPAWGIQNF
ncbi:MAG: polyphosphate polymerase domain-containing protein [Lachnospiraceae bacterium]